MSKIICQNLGDIQTAVALLFAFKVNFEANAGAGELHDRVCQSERGRYVCVCLHGLPQTFFKVVF